MAPYSLSSTIRVCGSHLLKSKIFTVAAKVKELECTLSEVGLVWDLWAFGNLD